MAHEEGTTQPADEGPVQRPVRPDCFEFAMDFLGGPEDEQVRAYVDALEAWADAAVAAERERCAKLCEGVAWQIGNTEQQREAARYLAAQIRRT